MIDIFVNIIELLINSVKSYSDAHDVRRKREFGQSLATCYFRLLEVCYTGYSIVSRLEYFEQQFREHAKDGWKHHHASLLEDLQKQNLNLIRLGHSIQSVAKEIYILDSETAVKLGTLVTSKKNAIAELAYSLGAGDVPLEFSVTNERLDVFVRNKSTAAEHDFKFLTLSLGNHTVIKSEIVSTTKDWELAEYQKVKNYLNIYQPRKRLGELKENTDKLRELMLKHFDLEDILWSVDKFRDDTRYLF